MPDKETVVVVDDDESILYIIQRALKARGYSVITATSAQQVLEYFKSSDAQIDLIITDLSMPGMNGQALVEHLWVDKPQLKVVYTSGHQIDTLIHQGHLDQNACFLAKPFGPTDVIEKVHLALYS